MARLPVRLSNRYGIGYGKTSIAEPVTPALNERNLSLEHFPLQGRSVAEPNLFANNTHHRNEEINQ